MPINTITIPRWFDRHLHLRDGLMMETVLPCTLNQRATGAVIMGNLKHPDETSTVEKAFSYRSHINFTRNDLFFTEKTLNREFQPRMTCYLTDSITPEEIVRGFKEDVWCAVKLYMADQKGEGGTTGSAHGVRNLPGRYPVFEAMEEHGIPLLGHFEAVEDDVDEFDREIVSLERDLIPILKQFPKLKVVFEHITDGRAAEFVAESYYDICATVTPQHLMLNRNALFKGGMNPVYWCKPVLKREKHRLRVRGYVTSGNKRFGAGTDSAPHDEEAKSRPCGCAAGIFSAPCAVECYTTVFDEDNALHNLGPFMSENFLDFYCMEVSKEMMTIERKSFEVPVKVWKVYVFLGGKTLSWKLVG